MKNHLAKNPNQKTVKIQNAVEKYRELGVTGINDAPTLYFCNICGEVATEENVIKQSIEWGEDTYGFYCDLAYIEMDKSREKPLIDVDMGSTRHEYFFCSKKCGVTYTL